MGGVGRLKPSRREVNLRNIDVLGGEYLGVSCLYVREESELACLCLVSALAIQPVLLRSVLKRLATAAILALEKRITFFKF